ncbi:hypothetical protein RJT34_02769 [Clitoria ternatea]|uniref:Signal recognition particle SRP72 subunit RNA-binding domain-containing protein n=1 Tax=Clitoria ternatea TaxID=43366 RepID=A0AAN9KKF6_CLITE
MVVYKQIDFIHLVWVLIGQEILMEDNLPNDEIDIELSPIAVQLAYVQQLLGHKQDAIEAYTDIIKRDTADDSSIVVAMNNLVSLEGPKDVSDSLRKLDRLKEKNTQGYRSARGLDLKLSAKEKEVIYANRILLLLHANKIEQVFHLSFVIPVLLQATLLVRENKARRAEEILAQCAGKFPEKAKSNVMTEDNKLNIIMQEAASFKLRHGREGDAAQLYKELVKSQGSIKALVGLGINVDSFERTSGAKQVKGPAHVGLTETYEEGMNKTKAKKKRKRKPRYPKGFNPENPGPPLDLERWFPRRERSTYRPKRKDKRASQVRGSQGAMVREKHDIGALSNNSNPKSNQGTASKGATQKVVSEQTKPSSNNLHYWLQTCNGEKKI